jgi:hypothetical protein
MKRKSSYVLERIASWPKQDIKELVEIAREIEARRTGVYRLDDDERASVRIGMKEADIGQFMSDKSVADSDKHYGL